MKTILARIAVYAVPILISTARILLNEGKSDMEVALQKGLRQAARMVLEKKL